MALTSKDACCTPFHDAGGLRWDSQKWTTRMRYPHQQFMNKSIVELICIRMVLFIFLQYAMQINVFHIIYPHISNICRKSLTGMPSWRDPPNRSRPRWVLRASPTPQKAVSGFSEPSSSCSRKSRLPRAPQNHQNFDMLWPEASVFRYFGGFIQVIFVTDTHMIARWTRTFVHSHWNTPQINLAGIMWDFVKGQLGDNPSQSTGPPFGAEVFARAPSWSEALKQSGLHIFRIR